MTLNMITDENKNENPNTYEEAELVEEGLREKIVPESLEEKEKEKEKKKNTELKTLEVTPSEGVKLLKTGNESLIKFRSQEDLMSFANLMISQGLVPDSITKPGHVISIIQFGSELGIGIMTALNGIHNIKGKPTLSVHLIAARLRERGFKYRILKDYANEQIGTKEGKPVYTRVTTLIFTEYFKVGNNIEKLETEFSFNWREATLEGLTIKDNWVRMPRQMLLNRTLVRGARFVCPESTLGLYETSELADTFDVNYTLDEEGNAKVMG